MHRGSCRSRAPTARTGRSGREWPRRRPARTRPTAMRRRLGPRTGTRRRRSRSCRAAARTPAEARQEFGQHQQRRRIFEYVTCETQRRVERQREAHEAVQQAPAARAAHEEPLSESASIVAPIAAANMLTRTPAPLPPSCRRENQHRHGRHRHAELRINTPNTGPRAERRWNSDGKCHTAALLEGMRRRDEGRRHRWAAAGTPAADPMHHGILNGFGRDRAEHAPSARASRPSVTVTCRCAGQAARRVPRRETRRPARPRRPVRIPRTRSPAPPCSRRARHAPATRSARRTSSRPARRNTVPGCVSGLPRRWIVSPSRSSSTPTSIGSPA